MTSATLAFAFVAGLLSTLSPCVLPLLPIVLGAAAGEHRFGPLALAAGVALSFVAIGMFIATVGYSIGLDQSVFRMLAATLLIALGIVLIVPRGGNGVRDGCRAGRGVGRKPLRRSRNVRPRRSIRSRPSAGLGVEPVCRSHSWRGVRAGGLRDQTLCKSRS